jgi:threonine aldolase
LPGVHTIETALKCFERRDADQMTERPGFASDNHAGVHPEVIEAIAAANDGHAAAYGGDPWTALAVQRFREHFGPAARAFPVFNGTAANVLCLETLTQPWQAVVCARTAHLHVDECGAPERAGRKLLIVDTPDGRLTPELVEPLLVRIGDEHVVQPRVVSITQSTELGTVYTPDAIAALARWAHSHGLLLHVDGARLCNAAAALGVPLRALTTDAGVDALSFGGTKIGLMGAEAVVLLRDDLPDGFKYLRKQSMQLASKMRYISAQLDALLGGDLWRRAAEHANAMARRLADAVRDAPGVAITQPVEANGVFAILPPAVTARLQEDWPFYVWDDGTGEVRWMTAWDTTTDDVDRFVAIVAEEFARRR